VSFVGLLELIAKEEVVTTAADGDEAAPRRVGPQGCALDEGEAILTGSSSGKLRRQRQEQLVDAPRVKEGAEQVGPAFAEDDLGAEPGSDGNDAGDRITETERLDRDVARERTPQAMCRVVGRRDDDGRDRIREQRIRRVEITSARHDEGDRRRRKAERPPLASEEVGCRGIDLSGGEGTRLGRSDRAGPDEHDVGQ
jgi:hypothetical protein